MARIFSLMMILFLFARMASAQTVSADKNRRPAPLIPLYTSYVTLNVLDLHFTFRALDSGNAREINPLLAGIAKNKPAMIAIKAAGTTIVIYGTEKIWKKGQRKTAVFFLIAANVGYAAIVAHNYKVGSRALSQ